MATTYPTIRQGSTGASVSFLQKNLITLGYGSTLAPYGADGIFGAKTNQAVRDFQTKHALGVDGVVGEKTWNKIISLVPSSDVLVNTIQATIAPPPPKPTPQAIAPPPPSLPVPTLPEKIQVTETNLPSAEDNSMMIGAGVLAVALLFVFMPKSKKRK